MNHRSFVMIAVLAIAVGLIGPGLKVCAADTTVWLVVNSQGEDSEGRLRVPLEWLAHLDQKEEISLTVNGDRVRAKELWSRYRALPDGSSEEIERGVDRDGDAYVTRIVSEAASRKKAEGRVHILSWDEDGKKTDIRLPLDLGGLLSTVAQMAGAIFGETTRAKDIDAAVRDKADLTRLAEFGPFLLAEQKERDGSRIKVQIE